MKFELTQPTEVTITNVNGRVELHGEDRVQAVDIAFTLTGPNTLLDMLKPGLREHFYFNAAKKAGQKALLADEPLPNLRHAELPAEGIAFRKGEKWRGYRFQRDYGTQGAVLDFTDAVLSGIKFDCLEGGTVTIYGTIQYNGEELADRDVLGDVISLAVERNIHMVLLAPPELLKVGKGYRANRPDTKPSAGAAAGQRELGEGGDGDDDDEQADDDREDTSTATGAFLAAGGPAVKH